MIRRRQPPSQTWLTLLRDHIRQIMAGAFLVVPTATYQLLFFLVPLGNYSPIDQLEFLVGTGDRVDPRDGRGATARMPDPNSTHFCRSVSVVSQSEPRGVRRLLDINSPNR